MAKEKQIQVSFDYRGIEHGDVYSDRKKVGQILQIVAANAVKYTRPPGRVSLTARELVVSDNYVKAGFPKNSKAISMNLLSANRIQP